MIFRELLQEISGKMVLVQVFISFMVFGTFFDMQLDY